MKEFFQYDHPGDALSSIQFGILSNREIISNSLVKVSKIPNADANTQPGQQRSVRSITDNYALCDGRLGQTGVAKVCDTCQKKEKCVGHFGHIDLKWPIYHSGFMKQIAKILNVVCKSCSKVMLPNEVKEKLLLAARRTTNFLNKKSIFQSIVEHCKKTNICPHCNFRNGSVKLIAKTILIMEKFKGLKKVEYEELREYKARYEEYYKKHPEMKFQLPENPVEVLHPEKVFKIFTEIPDEEVALFGMDLKLSHPADLILTRVIVPPNNIRPSPENRARTGVNQDALTTKLNDIIYFSNELDSNQNTAKLLDFIQWSFQSYIDGEAPPPGSKPTKAVRGLIQRLKGKTGRFRGNLLGKRVDFSARTVISPDPTLQIYQVGVPKDMARRLTFPELVTPFNIERLRRYVKNGRRTYPGAESVIQNGCAYTPNFVRNLAVGDTVLRHMVEGDVVLFNRQPSLHKNSIMCHTVKVHEWKTLRFNECVCTPYNADFDGDEMNLHFPQTYPAKVEAYSLMGVTSNLVTAKNGSLLIAATQDFITGSHLMTRKDIFLTHEEANNLIICICPQIRNKTIKLPIPAILKPVKLWTGKQIFTVVINENRETNKVNCNLLAQKKGYKKGKEMTADETFACIRNSEILAGSLDKSLVGSGCKKNIFYVLLKEHGPAATASSMWRLTRMAIAYMSNYGFSIGINDVTPTEQLLSCKQGLLNAGSEKCDELINSYNKRTIKCQPGCNMEETLEQKILCELSEVRDLAGKACAEELSASNSGLIMAICGSKGSLINVSQMVACVGQQAIAGKRTPNGFQARGLPYFEKNSRAPLARGFVGSSFYSGLFPTEFIFHTMAGREGLIDTAVKTADTGYLQRRLVKFLEDLFVAHDNTVRNSAQDVIQLLFGNDGLDPSHLEHKNIVDFERLFDSVRSSMSSFFAVEESASEDFRDAPLNGSMLLEYARFYLDEDICKDLSQRYKHNILSFLEERGQIIDEARSKLNYVSPERRRTGIFGDIERVTGGQLEQFLRRCVEKYQQSQLQPGTPIGAITATSLGEPATQMTLKTFHFAGVASMNITLGVPRIQEILNANKIISTPVIKAQLLRNNNAAEARRVAHRIGKTTLKDVLKSIREVYTLEFQGLVIEINLEQIELIDLGVSIDSICDVIATTKLKNSQDCIKVLNSSTLAIKVTHDKMERMHMLKTTLPNLTIAGYVNIPRVVVNQVNEKDGARYELLVEGGSLRNVMGTYGVNGNKCTSNHTIDVEATLGIEAARVTIINEITHTMSTHGLDVDERYVTLLADLMTCQGKVLGVTRHGLAKMNKSVLTLASFEQMTDHLFEASTLSQKNDIQAVSDCNIVGNPMNTGTGHMKILQKYKESTTLPKRKYLFDQPQLHIRL